MHWLIMLVVEILKVLLPELLKSRKPTMEVGRTRPELREKLRERVREKWGRTTLPVLLILALLVGGCSQVRTVYVPDGEPVRLRTTIRAAKVWVVDAGGEAVPGEMDLLEGWFCLSLKEEEIEKPP